MKVETRLEGGPHDGDTAWAEVRLQRIYTVACARGAAECELDGVHWWTTLKAAKLDAAEQKKRGGWATGDVEVYVYSRTDGKWRVFIYGDLTDEGQDALTARALGPLAAA